MKDSEHYEAFIWAKQQCERISRELAEAIETIPPHKQHIKNPHYKILRSQYNTYTKRLQTFKEFAKAFTPKPR